MGILLVYDVTDESSFANIRNWMRNIEAHASENVVKVIIGNKCDMDESKRAVPYSRGKVGVRAARRAAFRTCRRAPRACGQQGAAGSTGVPLGPCVRGRRVGQRGPFPAVAPAAAPSAR